MFQIQNLGQKSAIGRVLRRPDDFLRQMSLKTRVVLLVVVMLVACIWGLALGVTLALQRDLMQLHSANLSAEVAGVTADLDRDVRLYIDLLARLATSLSPDILADPAKLDRALDQFADSSVIVPETCFVANGKGIITAGYPEHAVRLGASVEHAGYFRDVVASDKPAIGVPELAGATQQRPTVPIGVPLRNGSGATVGALVGHVLLSDPVMLGQIQTSRIGKRGYFLVFSPKDRLILAAPDPSRILQRLPPKGVIPLLDRRVEEGFQGAGILVNALGVEHLGVAQKMATTGWMVLAAAPTNEIFAPIEEFKRRVYLAALLISLTMAIILRFFLARQFAPLKEAGGAIRRMSEGKIPMAAIPVTRQDEIGELITDFNRLVAERSRLDQSLQAEIIERKRANEALRESSDRLEGIYLSVGDGIISTDAQQRIVLFNSAAERIFGYSAAEMIGRPFCVLLPARLRTQHEEHIRDFDTARQAIRGKGTYGVVCGLRRSGEEFPIEAAVSQSGIPPNGLFTVILRDITERRQAEQVREQLTRHLELLSERLATVHEDEHRDMAYELHEQLGQELATLQIYLGILGSGDGGTHAQGYRDDALALTRQAIERVRKMVRNIDPSPLEELGLYAAAVAYCRQQTAAAGWKMHIDAPRPDMRPPRAVERACFSVLQEALNNVLRHAQASEVWVHLHQDAEALELGIRDDGIGFDAGAVGDEHGQGSWWLGLFGMQTRVKQAGGRLQIESSPGAGTEVYAVFPLPADADEPV
jgi:PAS domain S-box-containing protein